jgi:hypothetical protein
MKLSRMKPAGKPLFEEKKTTEFLGTGQECKDVLLPSVKRNICESMEMCSLSYILDIEGVPHSIVSVVRHIYLLCVCNNNMIS